MEGERHPRGDPAGRLARRRSDRRSPGLASGSHHRSLDRRRQLPGLGGARC
jgi:hypothetical protein